MGLNSKPIGVFDSGIGGLTVVKALRELLPNENIIYFGDTARVPYGTKSTQTIINFAGQDTEFLITKDVKLIVVGCNTVSSTALDVLLTNYTLPIIGVLEPGARAAALNTENNKVGVIGTPATIKTNAYPRKIRDYKSDAMIFSQACPLFVPLVEEGWENTEIALLTARQYLAPLLAQEIDTLVLGCTHYPLLKDTIRRVSGDQVKLIDSAEQTAQQVRQLLTDLNLMSPPGNPGNHKFYLSDIPPNFIGMAERFLGEPLSHVQREGKFGT
jgi:glutamate racemase